MSPEVADRLTVLEARFDDMHHDTKGLVEDIKCIQTKLVGLEIKLAESRGADLDNRFSQIAQKVDNLAEKMGNISDRLGRVEVKAGLYGGIVAAAVSGLAFLVKLLGT